jgi:hypothetical protein
MNSSERQAYTEGQYAGHLGLPARDNPNPGGTPEHQAWERGRIAGAEKQLANRAALARGIA